MSYQNILFIKYVTISNAQYFKYLPLNVHFAGTWKRMKTQGSIWGVWENHNKQQNKTQICGLLQCQRAIL